MSEYELQCFDNRDNKECVEYLIEKHKPLVFYIVNQYKSNSTQFEYSELISSGLYGLYKAIMTFNIEKNFKFATYASTCIHNEIRMLFRKARKHRNEISIYTELHEDFEGNIMTYYDILPDRRVDVQYDNIMVREIYQNIKLTDLEKKLINLRLEGKTQREIASILDFSQSYVSRLLQKIYKKIKNHL